MGRWYTTVRRSFYTFLLDLEVLITPLGSLFSLKHKKKDVDEMRKDSECGLLFDNWDDVMLGDKVQCFEEVSERVPF